MGPNNNSPVVDGIWYRPFLMKAHTTDTGATTDGNVLGNSLPAGAKVGYVSAVNAAATDRIRLPSLADVPNGHEMIIIGQASSNFRLATPASSTEKINNVNSDGTNSYLVTDTDIVLVRKINNTIGWVAQSITNLGAVRTAVIPN